MRLLKLSKLDKNFLVIHKYTGHMFNSKVSYTGIIITTTTNQMQDTMHIEQTERCIAQTNICICINTTECTYDCSIPKSMKYLIVVEQLVYLHKEEHFYALYMHIYIVLLHL